MRKDQWLKIVFSFILCFCFLFVSSVNMAFATGIDSSASKGSDKNLRVKNHYRTSNKISLMQSFILDSMDSKNNKKISKELSTCTLENTSSAAQNIAQLLKGSWKSEKGLSSLNKVLTNYLTYTPKAQLALTMIINEGLEGVKIPFILSYRVKAKINNDFTGKSNDDRGVKFMVKALQIFQRLASLNDERLVSVTFDKLYRPTLEFNRLEDYSYITSSISEVLGTLDNLPFSSSSFEDFIGYYENYINGSRTYEVLTFVHLLRVNNISYSIVINR